jgi:GNAT superfamily N-acetyltransferase
LSDLLDRHLRTWLGAWPPPPGRIVVVGSEARTTPGWDGAVRAVLGVASPDGAVVSVAPAVAREVGAVGEAAAFADLAEVGERLGGTLWEAAFRWSDAPASQVELPDLGVWVSTSDPRVPDWLKPFNGDVLVAFVDDRYVAGVGIKVHNEYGHELSVGTEPAAQGRGLARRLVATAARAVIERGAVPTYLHDFANVASARVAEAAGFPDRGWRVLGLGRG